MDVHDDTPIAAVHAEMREAPYEIVPADRPSMQDIEGADRAFDYRRDERGVLIACRRVREFVASQDRTVRLALDDAPHDDGNRCAPDHGAGQA